MSRYSLMALALWIVATLAPLQPVRAAPQRTLDPNAAQPRLADAESAESITWLTDVAKAFAEAESTKKLVMICVNARYVGAGREEPAAKGLREVIYKDPRVVRKSRAFICVLIKPEGSSQDYGELRARFGIDGNIVSPQHIFAHPLHPAGAAPLTRKQYWPYGKGEAAVEALLGLMDKATAAYRELEGLPPVPTEPAPELPVTAPPPAQDAPSALRVAWIAETLLIVLNKPQAERVSALRVMIAEDKEGDCVGAILSLVDSLLRDKKIDILLDVVRALGVPGLDVAALRLHDLLKHKDVRVRANAAVTLEYVGSKQSVAPLVARLKREKDEHVANHLCRALGRCGKGDDKVRRRLLKRVPPQKRDFTSYGPVIGLAYFEGDEKLARSMEKELLKVGQPFGGRSRHTYLRALMIWCLSEIRDPKTAPFLRKRYIAPLDKVTSRWKDDVWKYYDAAARKCEGAEDAQDAIEAGIQRYLRWGRSARELQDEARLGRDTSRFEPKGEWVYEDTGD